MIYIKKILSHPLFIILIFCGIIISGQQMGGFYIFYLMLGLPHFVLHAILGVPGIVCLLITYYHKKIVGSVLRVLGAVLMIASLLSFFLQSKGSYNYNTFYELLPLSTLIIFAVAIINFIINNIYAMVHYMHKKEPHLTE